MHIKPWLFAGLMMWAGMSAGPVSGQTSVVHLAQNGQLSWTNAVNSNALYRVEWAADLEGPWHRTLDNMRAVDGRDASHFSVLVPMYYRVIMTTNPPPVGMVWIDGGDVELGQAGIGEALVHTNFISGFWMDATEVTKKKWDDVVAYGTAHGYHFENEGLAKAHNHPVFKINWYNAVKWCNARSQQEGLIPCYYIDASQFGVYKNGTQDLGNDMVKWTANGYRLPTEAEWEKAARGGRQGRLFPWSGDTIQHAQANYFSDTNTAPYDVSPTPGYHPDYHEGTDLYTSPVGSFPANGYGLHDMIGNILEWCWDWYDHYPPEYQVDPRGPEVGQALSPSRVSRGGSWSLPGYYTPCAYRANLEITPSYVGPGFRCVRGP